MTILIYTLILYNSNFEWEFFSNSIKWTLPQKKKKKKAQLYWHRELWMLMQVKKARRNQQTLGGK